MLVLSRRVADRISFPTRGITVEVVKVKGDRERLGVQAPDEIPIVRDELLEQASQLTNAKSRSQSSSNHAFQNRFNRALLNLNLAGKFVESGDTEGGLESLSAGLEELGALELNESEHAVAKQGTHIARDCDKRSVDFGSGDFEPRVLLVDDEENERVLISSYLPCVEVALKLSKQRMDCKPCTRLQEFPAPMWSFLI